MTGPGILAQAIIGFFCVESGCKPCRDLQMRWHLNSALPGRYFSLYFPALFSNRVFGSPSMCLTLTHIQEMGYIFSALKGFTVQAGQQDLDLGGTSEQHRTGSNLIRKESSAPFACLSGYCLPCHCLYCHFEHLY